MYRCARIVHIAVSWTMTHHVLFSSELYEAILYRIYQRARDSVAKNLPYSVFSATQWENIAQIGGLCFNARANKSYALNADQNRLNSVPGKEPKLRYSRIPPVIGSMFSPFYTRTQVLWN